MGDRRQDRFREDRSYGGESSLTHISEKSHAGRGGSDLPESCQSVTNMLIFILLG